MARTVRKLVDGDEGFDAGVDKFEVIDTSSIAHSKVKVRTVAECQARIDGLGARKALDLSRWDERIADAEQLKLDVLAAV